MKILHLYHDIMNLYGEYANVAAMQRMLEKNNVPCEIDKLSVNDNLSFMDYDFIYVGSGTESNQKYVLEHLMPYKNELKEYMEAGKMLLMTGNSFEILGNILKDAKGKAYEGLGFFDFSVKEQERIRNTADAVFTMEGQEKPLVGFINKCSTMEGIDLPLFQVKMGLGNEEKGTVRESPQRTGTGSAWQYLKDGCGYKHTCDSFVTEKVTLKSKIYKIERSLIH